MNNTTKRGLPVLLPSKGILKPIIRALYSIKNFVKASVLSLLILLIIFFLLSQMEQAYTMFLRMIEFGKPSLALCFVLLNLLAIGLSHFPIYTYYAGNLNGSRKYVKWRKENPYKFPVLNKINIYTFEPIFHPNYIKDIYSNVLRQYLGLTLFLIWIHFIFSTFKPNLIFTVNAFMPIINVLVYGIAIIPFITYLVLKRKLSKLHSNIKERRRIYKRLGKLFTISSFFAILLFIFVIFYSRLFSQAGFLLLLLTTYAMMFSFTFFRLIRPRVSLIIKYLNNHSNKKFSKILSIVVPLESSTNYLIVFQISFLLSVISIIYFNLASVMGLDLPNGIAIVLIYLFSFFFIISSIGKYYFVQFSLAKIEKETLNTYKTLNKSSFAIGTLSLITIIILFIVGFFTESSLNELTVYPSHDSNFKYTHVPLEERIGNMSDTVYFVNSHGGGLKANAWTLLVLNKIQKETNGKFIKQCISFSGASGGSLGLAIYGNLYGIHGNDYKSISKKIDIIRNKNYASVDISMLFGLDALRIAWPLNRIKNSNDRAYFGMIKYQNIINDIKEKKLMIFPFRGYWHKLQEKGNQLPALIMNTASTNGQRGIFCTLNSKEFDTIFPFSINLTNLIKYNNGEGSISFYEAISTTNRFPVFSPVAKIKGYGHFIDAGAIDNSGILSNWDLYLYLRQKNNSPIKNKHVVFVDIENGKDGYTEHILNSFLIQIKAVQLLNDENEKSAIVANLQTGLSLDKIPGYLKEFMINYTRKNSHIEYKQIFLPHKISINDIESLVDGKIKENLRNDLKLFLDKHNKTILDFTEKEIGFWDAWSAYEPVLSRHLSYSNNVYFDKIIDTKDTGIEEVVNYAK